MKRQRVDRLSPCIVIGAGAAGYTCALYLAQSNLQPKVLEGDKPGGSLTESSMVRNFPSAIEKSGYDIMMSMRDQVEMLGTTLLAEDVIGVDFSSTPLKVISRDRNNGETVVHPCLTCVIAMGSKYNQLHLPDENLFWKHGIYHCALCDAPAPLYKGKIMGVVGGGDSSLHTVTYLSRFAKKIYVFVRKNTFKGHDKQREAYVRSLPNVKIFFNTEVKRFLGPRKPEPKLTGIITENNRNGKKLKFNIDALFLAIGNTPNTSLFKSTGLRMDDNGYIIVDQDQATNIPGVFAAGDICDRKYRQAITACAYGCIASFGVQHFLDTIGWNLLQTEIQIGSPTAPEKPLDPFSMRKSLQSKNGKDGWKLASSSSQLLKSIESCTNVLIEIFSPTCSSCRQMEPVFAKIGEMATRKNYCLFKIDASSIDVSPLLLRAGMAPGSGGLPMLLLFEKGTFIKKWIGVQSLSDLSKALNFV